MTTTITGFPGFAPGEHRQLLAEVSGWAHANGWATTRDTGWQDPSRLTQVDWDERGLFIGSRDSVDHVWKTPRHWPAASVPQAVDFLVALGILPARFSSAYKVADGLNAELLDAVGQVIAKGRLDFEHPADGDLIYAYRAVAQ